MLPHIIGTYSTATYFRKAPVYCQNILFVAEVVLFCTNIISGIQEMYSSTYMCSFLTHTSRSKVISKQHVFDIM